MALLLHRGEFLLQLLQFSFQPFQLAVLLRSAARLGKQSGVVLPQGVAQTIDNGVKLDLGQTRLNQLTGVAFPTWPLARLALTRPQMVEQPPMSSFRRA